MERRFGWLAFPGLIRSIALLQAAFFVVLIFNENAMEPVSPNWELVKAGEVWRLIGFIFFPPEPPGTMPILSAVFMFFAVRICFMISDGLEQAWGEFRTSLFVYAIIICQSLAYHALDGAPPLVFYVVLFLGFATVYPSVQLLFMLIIPMKIWIIAAFIGFAFFLQAIAVPALFFPTLLCFLPYLIWAVPMLIRWRKTKGQVVKRRNTFEKAKLPAQNTLHRCAECQRTEASHPDLEFRVAENDEEYCLDHLPSSSNSPS